MQDDKINTKYSEEGELILIDKELYWTSFDIVRKIKNVLCNKYKIKKLKVGHAGTLDPLATGLVIVCTGKKTKTIQGYQDAEKEYVAVVKLGSTTPSFDLETNVDKTYSYEHIGEEDVITVLRTFEGINYQVPPLFSAKNLDGKMAYEYARQGSDLELKPNKVEFFHLSLINFELPFAKIKIRCSKGTYIRSFARDFGLALNSGGHLVELRRTMIGEFHVDRALSIKQFELKTNMQNL
jgi:tRNA pseudouridine55 synthase